MKVIFITILSITIIFSFLGCQAPASYYVRDNVFPEDTTTLLILSPILFPLYAVMFVVDVAIVNPIRGVSNVPETLDKVWGWGKDSSTPTKIVLIPVQAIASPIAAIGTILFSEQFITSSTPSPPSEDGRIFKTYTPDK